MPYDQKLYSRNRFLKLLYIEFSFFFFCLHIISFYDKVYKFVCMEYHFTGKIICVEVFIITRKEYNQILIIFQNIPKRRDYKSIMKDTYLNTNNESKGRSAKERDLVHKVSLAVRGRLLENDSSSNVKAL